MSKKTAKREVTILARYVIKKDHVNADGKTFKAGSIILYVRNDKGECYYTTLRRSKVHSCSCPATKRCYHINHCVEIENARAAAKREAAAKLKAEVEALCTEVEAELARETVTANVTPPARELAPLNGNRVFSILH